MSRTAVVGRWHCSKGFYGMERSDELRGHILARSPTNRAPSSSCAPNLRRETKRRVAPAFNRRRYQQHKGCPILRVLCEGWEPRTPRPQDFFITFFSCRHHRHAPKSVRWFPDSAASRTVPASGDGSTSFVTTILGARFDNHEYAKSLFLKTLPQSPFIPT